MWKGLLLAGGIPVVIAMVTFFLSDKKTKTLGITVGKIISRFFRQKSGKAGEKVGEKTVNTLMEGIKIGMALDNDRIIVKQINKTGNEEEKRSLKERLTSIIK